MAVNLFDIVREIQKHVRRGETVSPYDDPFSCVLGFESHLERWEVSLYQAKRELGTAKTGLERKVVELFRTPVGRKRLCTEVLHEDDTH